MTTTDVWAGQRALVTGATGMVGAWLVKELLAHGALVVALVRDADPQSELFRSGDAQRVTIVNGALEDYATCARAIATHETVAVFHLGEPTHGDAAQRAPWQTFESNVRGTYNLLEACRVNQSFIKAVVVASSDKAYGEAARVPYTEEMPLGGRNPYDASQSAADLIAQSYHHAYGLPVAIARCGNIYGGGDLHWRRIVPGTIRSLVRGAPPLIRSDGRSVRDYLYVKDAARAFMRLAEYLDDERVRGEAFNFSAESPSSALDLVRAIQRLMQVEQIAPRILNLARGETRDQRSSAVKARARLAWKAEFALERGLTETIAWYRDFLK